MSELTSGGYHWQTKEHVAGWDRMQHGMASERDFAFRALIKQLPKDAAMPLRIVDLGAGDGKVASVVLDHFQQASAILVDFSVPMMEKGQETLKRFEGRCRYELWDMNEGEWPDHLRGPYDAAVSSAAIHHLVNPRKQWLASAVLDRLVLGGIFANYDLFRNPDAVFAEDDVHGRTCATIEEATDFLKNSGFKDILLTERLPRPKHQGELALLIGRKVGPSQLVPVKVSHQA